MKKFIIAALLLFPTLSYAQGIEMGFGIGVPLTSRNITTDALVDSLGVVRATRTLDAGPQILLEFHKAFKVKELGIGPMIGFLPKIDFGTVTNAESEQPIGAGIGILVKVPSKTKQHFNIGVLWVVTAPVQKVDSQWVDGFQAPRASVSGLPLEVQFSRGSTNRLMIVATVSGLF
jgi:hypothetical protein